MKKKLGVVVTAIALVAVMLFTLCACGSTWGKIKSAYEKESYTEIQLSDEVKALIENNEDFKAAQETATLHVLQKGGSLIPGYVFILEYKGNKEMEEALKKHVTKEDAENVYEELQKLDTVNGNCFLLLSTATDGTSIFKGTK